MPLQKEGVEYISKGFSQFINNLSKASAAISNLGRITANRLAALQSYNEAMVKMSNSTARMVASSNKAATNLARLQLLKDINEAFLQGKISVEAYGMALNGINNKAIKLANTLQKLPPSFGKLKSMTSGLAGGVDLLGDKGIFKGVSQWGRAGKIIGGILGTIVPGIGNVLGLVIGQLSGMWLKLQMNIFKGIADVFWAVPKALLKYAPKVIKGIVDVGIQVGKALWNFAKQIVNIAKTIVSPITNAVKSLFNAVLGIFGIGGAPGKGGWRSLGNTIFSAMFKFEILKQVIRGVINEMKQFAISAFEAATELQTLTARVDNLIAMQIRNAGITKDYAQSINMAVPYTQELLKWMQELALATPISIEDISNVTYLSLAMGWSVEGAKKLTKAVIDYTAALGMGSEISERIIYNFAQMRQQGKVTSTELRDLGRGAFMPINDILLLMYDNMKKTTKATGEMTVGFQQFREEVAAGKYPVEAFFKAFEDFIALNLPDMAYKMNYTFQAVKQNVSDLFKILLGWNVLGPMIESITKPVQDFIARFKSDEVLAKANAIGRAIAYIIDYLRTGFMWISGAFKNIGAALQLPKMSIESVIKSLIKLGLLLFRIEVSIGNLIGKLVPFAKQIGDKVGGTFDKMGDDFFSFGLKLIYNFASGMMQGAAKFITMAIRAITRLLTGWFMGHSPPKIAPKIDLWGMETVNEWLHGFLQADFDILDDMQGSLKSALDALVAFGVFTDQQSSQAYVNMSMNLIQAMDELNRTGNITIDVFKELRAVGGVYGREITELLDLQMRHLVILKAYNEAIKKRERLEVSTNKMIREYNMMVRKGADRNLLKNKLKLVNASEMELDVARKAEIEKKSQLELIEEQVKLQESLIKQLVELAQAQKDAMKELAGVGAGVGGDGEPFGDMDEAFKKLQEEIDKIDFEGLKLAAEKEFRDLFTRLGDDWKKTMWDNFSSPTSEFQIAMGNLKTAWSGTIAFFKAEWDKFAAAVGLPSIEKITEAWNAPQPTTMPMPGATVTSPLGAQGTVAGQTLTYGQPTLLDRFRSVIQSFADAVEKGDNGILGALGRAARYIWDKLIEFLNNPYTEIITTPEGKAEVQRTSRLSQFFVNIKDAMLDAIELIDWSEVGNKVWTKIKESIASILEENAKKYFTAENILKLITPGGVSDIIGDIANFFTPDNVKTGKDEIDTFNQYGADLGNGLVGGVSGIIDNFETWDSIWDIPNARFTNTFRNKSESKLYIEYGQDIAKGLVTGITNQLNQTKWSSVWKIIINKFKEFFNIGLGIIQNSPMYKLGMEIVNGIKAGILAGYNSLRALLAKIGINLPAILADVTETESPSKVFKRQGYDWMLGLQQGINHGASVVEKAMLGTVGNYAMSPLARMAAPVSASPVYGGNTVNFGDVHISNSMDWAVFKAQVQRAIIGD